MLRAALVWLALAGTASAQNVQLQLRVLWGGDAQAWRGSISLAGGSISDLRPLGVDSDAGGALALEGAQVTVRPAGLRTFDGCDLFVSGPPEARLVIDLSAPNPTGAALAPLDLRLGDLVDKPFEGPWEGHPKHWLSVRRAPGDQLRVHLQRSHLVFSPGEVIKFELEPVHLEPKPGTHVHFEIQLRDARTGVVQSTQSKTLIVGEGSPALPRFPLEFQAPATEGAFDIAVQASVRRLKFSTTIGRNMLREVIAERKVQFVTVRTETPPGPSPTKQADAIIDEINPAAPIQGQRLGNWNLVPVPGWRRNPTVGGEGEVWKYQTPGGTAELVRLGMAGAPPELAWQAFTLRVSNPGQPHILEVEYPANVPQSLGISLVEPNATGAVVPVGVDSGVYVPEASAELAPSLAVHRMVIWPRTRAPVVLLTNRQDGRHALFGKIRILQVRTGRLWFNERSALPTGQRLAAGYLDRPLWAENVGASQAADTVNNRSLKDWTTFLEGTERMADYLRHTGRNALFVNIAAEGSAIYPSRLLEPTPRFDNGPFFASGQDPLRKDVLELALRIFDREHLALIPSLQFAAPLPAIERLSRRLQPGVDGVTLVGAEGRSWRDVYGAVDGLAPDYNPLDRRVQDAMVDVVGELMDRYAHHPSLAGIAIDLTAQGYAQLPGLAWGLDDETMARFQAETGATPPGGGPERFAARAKALSGPLAPKWLAWRARKLADFHRQIQTEVARRRPDCRVYLTTGNLLSNREAESDLCRGLPQGMSAAEALYAMGIDPGMYRDAGDPVLMRPHLAGPAAALPIGTLALDVNAATELDQYFRQAPQPAAQFYHPPYESRLPSFDQRSPFKPTFTQMWSQLVPAGIWNRQRYAHALATLDAVTLCDGGMTLPLGQEEELQSFLATYKSLPAARFETWPQSPQPVTVRFRRERDQMLLYAVNDSPWPAHIRVSLELPPGCTATSLGRPADTMVDRPGVTTWDLTLEPFGLAGLRYSSPEVRITDVQLLDDGPIRRKMSEELDELDLRLAGLVRMDTGSADRPTASHVAWDLSESLENASFEQAPAAAGGQLPGWDINQWQGVAYRIDPQEKYTGRQSLVLSTTGPVATLAGPTFTAPASGRLLMSVWLRVADPRRQPPLRLALEGQWRDQPYYRFAAVGEGVGSPTIAGAWRCFLFRVDDLPRQGLTQLRIRFDLMGPGEVWIDEVQLASVVLSQAELIHLQKSLATARFALDKGRLGDARRLLDGASPRQIAERVRITGQPGRAAVEEAPAVPRIEPEAPRRTAGWMDRLWPWR